MCHLSLFDTSNRSSKSVLCIGMDNPRSEMRRAKNAWARNAEIVEVKIRILYPLHIFCQTNDSPK